MLVVYPPAKKGGEPMFKMTMSRMSPDQRTLFEVLDLGRYLGRVGHTEKRALVRSALHF